MTNEIDGSCLCGEVTFRVKDEFSMFHLCHCTQCQKVTGSAHASNIFTRPDNIQWLSGDNKINRYDDPNRDFTKVFCTTCGTGLPFITKSGEYLIVPAGSLSRQPTMEPQDNIFWSERMPWYENAVNARHFDGFPK